jgi:hypothetical protein
MRPAARADGIHRFYISLLSQAADDPCMYQLLILTRILKSHLQQDVCALHDGDQLLVLACQAKLQFAIAPECTQLILRCDDILRKELLLPWHMWKPALSNKQAPGSFVRSPDFGTKRRIVWPCERSMWTPPLYTNILSRRSVDRRIF